MCDAVWVLVITEMAALCQDTALCRLPYRAGGNRGGGESHSHRIVRRKVPGDPNWSSKECMEEESEAKLSSDEEKLSVVLRI